MLLGFQNQVVPQELKTTSQTINSQDFNSAWRFRWNSIEHTHSNNFTIIMIIIVTMTSFYFYVCYSHSSVISGSDYVTFTELQNSTELTLTIHFVGEPGQVTRLFPQSILRGMGYPLDLKVILKVWIGLVSQLNELAKPLSRSDRPGY